MQLVELMCERQLHTCYAWISISKRTEKIIDIRDVLLPWSVVRVCPTRVVYLVHYTLYDHVMWSPGFQCVLYTTLKQITFNIKYFGQTNKIK